MGMTASLPLSKADRLAENAILKLVARGAMLLVVPLLVWNVKTLIDLQGVVQRIPDQILVVETRLAGRIGTIEDRLSGQGRRSDGQDQRIERLERPYFEPRRSVP
jgi:hypothetical protein